MAGMFGGGNTNGLEMALRSMGLGSVLDAAKQLAESGAVQKILKFADDLEETNARLARIEKRLGIEGPAIIEGTAELRAPGSAQSGSGAGNRDVA